jgi:mitochondrial-processing peptidase subunit beta
VRISENEMPQAHIAIAVEGAGWPNSDNIPLMVANTLIGSWDRSHGGGSGGMASRLALECARGALCNSFQVSVVTTVFNLFS